MSKDEFQLQLDYPSETRDIEYKENLAWSGKQAKAKITRAVIALSNLRDGGWLIVGKKQNPDGTFTKQGVDEDTCTSYNPDNIKDYLLSHIEPPVYVEVFREEFDGKKFVGIKVEGIRDYRHVCTKNESYKKKVILESGVAYVRSHGKDGNVKAIKYHELKELGDIEADIQLRRFTDQLKAAGLGHLIEAVDTVAQSDEDKFDDEIGDVI